MDGVVVGHDIRLSLKELARGLRGTWADAGNSDVLQRRRRGAEREDEVLDG